MNFGILLVTHQGPGPALKAAARQILGDTLPMPVGTFEVPADADLVDAALEGGLSSIFLAKTAIR